VQLVVGCDVNYKSKMKRIQTYQQGDPEWLIIHKQYHELQAEERDALSEWIQSPEDYDRMRQVLMELHDEPEEWVEPEASIKQNLMQKFASEEKGGKLIWLNSVFLTQGAPWHKQPLVRMTLAAACIIGLVVFFLPTSLPSHREAATAQQAEQSEGGSSDQKEALASADSSTKILQQFAEVKSEMPLVPTAVDTEFETSDVVQEVTESAMAEGDEVAYDVPDQAPAMAEDKDMGTAMYPKPKREETVVAGAAKMSTSTMDGFKKGVANAQAVNFSVSMAEVNDLLDVLYTAR
jgi:hypothetical protein